MNQIIYCDRPCKNYECEFHKCKIPEGLYAKKGVYALCKEFKREE